jgi:cytochrome c2
MTSKLFKLKILLLFLLNVFLNNNVFADEDVVYLQQGWTPQQRANFYWGSQGSALMSYDIYLALQLVDSDQLFNTPDNVKKLGLLISSQDHKNNPDNLPIGFTKTEILSGQFKGVYLGFNCALCHTGQINYKDSHIRIDGGISSHLDLSQTLRKLAMSLHSTLNDPVRFQEMVKRIKRTGDVNELELKSRLQRDLSTLLLKPEIVAVVAPLHPAGPGRMDALGAIHNSYAGFATGELGNLYRLNAPVKPPFLWNSPHFAWTQWSGNIKNNPLLRNYLQSLGVFAKYNLKAKNSEDGLFDSTTDILYLSQVEDLLKLLAPPKWPESILGNLDDEKVKQGKKLFTKNCAGCHSTYPYRWSEPWMDGKRMIENAIVPQRIVGTDDSLLKSIAFNTRPLIAVGKLATYFNGIPYVSSQDFYYKIAVEMIKKSYDNSGPISKDKWIEMNGYTSLVPPQAVPIGSFKASPRDGVWATGPFLHNASVPNIYELLSPASERSKKFHLTRKFDPEKLGVDISSYQEGDFLFDTSYPGNSNAGHSFEKGFRGPNSIGIIGRELAPKERYAIIEYLKSIPSEAGRATPFGGPKNPVIASQDKTWFNYKHPYNGQKKDDYIK